jgi:hypothetical protein
VSWGVFQLISIAILWWCIIRNVQIMRRLKRRIRETYGLIEITGVTPLQVQVAMDAAMTTFQQRIDEMRPHD